MITPSHSPSSAKCNSWISQADSTAWPLARSLLKLSWCLTQVIAADCRLSSSHSFSLHTTRALFLKGKIETVSHCWSPSLTSASQPLLSTFHPCSNHTRPLPGSSQKGPCTTSVLHTYPRPPNQHLILQGSISYNMTAICLFRTRPPCREQTLSRFSWQSFPPFYLGNNIFQTYFPTSMCIIRNKFTFYKWEINLRPWNWSMIPPTKQSQRRNYLSGSSNTCYEIIGPGSVA